MLDTAVMDIERIERSFALISPRLDELTMMFYSDLFTKHPEAKPLFAHVDLIRQRRKIAAMLTLIVTNLRRMDVLVAALRSLGSQHVGYGASPETYPWVEESLLSGIRHVAGDSWDDATESAWQTAINLVTTEMQAGVSDDPALIKRDQAGREDLDLLMEIAANPALSFKQDSLFSMYIQKKKTDHEMMLARMVQQDLIPKSFPTIKGYRFWSVYEPAMDVGGDYFDWLMPDDETLYVLFGDVSGKGIPGALMMCRLAGIVQALLAAQPNPTTVMAAINRHMCKRMPPGRFITAALLQVNLTSHRYTIVNAGHQPPLYVKLDRAPEFMSTSDGGLPIGIEKDAQYTSVSGTFTQGDTVLLYTDGVDEAMNPQGQMYGRDRLCAAVASADGADHITEALLNDMREFTRGRPRSDDVAMVSITRI